MMSMIWIFEISSMTMIPITRSILYSPASMSFWILLRPTLYSLSFCSVLHPSVDALKMYRWSVTLLESLFHRVTLMPSSPYQVTNPSKHETSFQSNGHPTLWFAWVPLLFEKWGMGSLICHAGKRGLNQQKLPNDFFWTKNSKVTQSTIFHFQKLVGGRVAKKLQGRGVKTFLR